MEKCDPTILRDRAAMLSKARGFFSERGVVEVDCPVLSSSASIDAHIDLFTTRFCDGAIRYMHSSPEYGMKRLLAMGMPDIYQMSHVFRDGELGKRHNPEFMLAEWYRLGFSFEAMIQETVDFVALFVDSHPVEVITYREVIKKHAGIDYVSSSDEELMCCLNKRGIEIYEGLGDEGRDAILNMIVAAIVEPNLDKDVVTVVKYYPASQAALAQKKTVGDEAVAERFEVYFGGYELANGYHELGDAEEQSRRFQDANEERMRMGKDSLPLDESFLEALDAGLPDCCGVAVGIDRLMMIRHGADKIADVLPFSW
ncbi:MAG: EF-P lysine aminoacylase GenX [Waddliaceae bacterium]|jgi:elongation factor P--(R)-beta-lysine ligase|nr:EF-P lysine aminoacylase GenX [Waddliaceae bacterium]MBT3578710.1 EF-P lysine aminoacylase GenX [Waddliaceae bacterium]MBT4444388.1 EF-P lysine aminoacylase GenX [Waddliaceae bacterium]MBT6928303.1 EF-P lysine aminoacylase GenX [Waddliaceae bacterium]MBT7264989.1 EF-P lysine aminoacylase GenX [Waddliaceae bacterium]